MFVRVVGYVEHGVLVGLRVNDDGVADARILVIEWRNFGFAVDDRRHSGLAGAVADIDVFVLSAQHQHDRRVNLVELDQFRVLAFEPDVNLLDFDQFAGAVLELELADHGDVGLGLSAVGPDRAEIDEADHADGHECFQERFFHRRFSVSLHVTYSHLPVGKT